MHSIVRRTAIALGYGRTTTRLRQLMISSSSAMLSTNSGNKDDECGSSMNGHVPGGSSMAPLSGAEGGLSAAISSSFNLESRADDIKAGLVDTFLNLERIDTNIYRALHLLRGRESMSAVYGGQVIGQALAAAALTVDPDFVAHSLHSYFLTTGSVDKPILYMIDRVRDGRSFCTRVVKAVQDGKAIFTSQISFHQPEPDAFTHQKTMPKIDVSPDELQDLLPLIRTTLNGAADGDPERHPPLNPAQKAILKFKLREIPPAFDRVFQIRPVDQDDYLLLKKSEHDGDEPRYYVWLKAKENIGDDIRLHQCIAAFISDATMIETAIRPHASNGFVPSMAYSLDHCIWFHREKFRIDDWMLYENFSPIARGSRSLIEGRLWNRDGELVLSAVQEGLIRSAKNNKLKMNNNNGLNN